MARSYAQVLTTIWADPDWRALSVLAQHAYLLVLSQPTLDFAGVAPLQVRKWSGGAQGLTEAALRGALDELQHARFLVVDEDTEECLVRSFIRNAEVWRQPNVVRRSLRDAVAAVGPAIRAALAAEIARIPWHELKGKRAEDTQKEAHDAAAALDPERVPGRVRETLPERVPETPQGKGSANPSQNPEEGFGEGFPEPRGIGTGTGTGTPSVDGCSSLSTREEKFAETITTNSDATRDEVPAILAHIRATHAPDSLGAWLRAVAARGDLPDVVDAARRGRTPTAEDVAPRDRARCRDHMLTLPCRSCAADAKAAS